MSFVAASLALGDEGSDLIQVSIDAEDLRLLAEVTLTLVLFSDASSLDTRRLSHESGIPPRLLVVALQLAIPAGAAVAIELFPDLAVFEAVVLAVLLAPTRPRAHRLDSQPGSEVACWPPIGGRRDAACR